MVRKIALALSALTYNNYKEIKEPNQETSTWQVFEKSRSDSKLFTSYGEVIDLNRRRPLEVNTDYSPNEPESGYRQMQIIESSASEIFESYEVCFSDKDICIAYHYSGTADDDYASRTHYTYLNKEEATRLSCQLQYAVEQSEGGDQS